MVEIWTKIVPLLLVPPGIILIVALLGFLIQIRWVLLGSLIVFLSFTALFILSLPLTGHQLMTGIESRFPPLNLSAPLDTQSPAGAIVVLGSGRYPDAVEYGQGDTVSTLALERLRYAVYLQRRTGLPILVSGGKPYGEQTSEAALMQEALTRDFQVEVKWMEDKSGTTFENAQYTKQMLAAAGIQRVYLVTHAWHMPRSVWAFENAGLSTIPAPMGFTTLSKEDRETLGYFPSAYGLRLSTLGLRERIGLMWYKRKYQTFETTRKTPAPAH